MFFSPIHIPCGILTVLYLPFLLYLSTFELGHFIHKFRYAEDRSDIRLVGVI